MSGVLIEACAAVKCSDRMRSTVATKSGSFFADWGLLNGVKVNAREVGDELRVRGV